MTVQRSQPMCITALPWLVTEARGRLIVREEPGIADGSDSYTVAETKFHSLISPEEAAANAALIVEAVNSHAALVQALEDARQSLVLADKMLSEHIEEYHDFDYEPHQVPPELASLRTIEHHLMGSLILDEEIAALSHRSAKT